VLGWVVVFLTVAVTLALVGYFFFSSRHPESAAGHTDEHPDTLAERFYGPVPPGPPGPAGPDAEL
jgi:hypothetical protein